MLSHQRKRELVIRHHTTTSWTARLRRVVDVLDFEPECGELSPLQTIHPFQALIFYMTKKI